MGDTTKKPLRHMFMAALAGGIILAIILRYVKTEK